MGWHRLLRALKLGARKPDRQAQPGGKASHLLWGIPGCLYALVNYSVYLLYSEKKKSQGWEYRGFKDRLVVVQLLSHV